MDTFEFVEPNDFEPFRGEKFYELYKDSDFLRCEKHVEYILRLGYQLREDMEPLSPGHTLEISNMWIKKNTIPLTVRKPGIVIGNEEFTLDRLTGLTAAIFYDNPYNYSFRESPLFEIPEAEDDGFKWTRNKKLYLSSIPGTEYFSNQFDYNPLLVALIKYRLKKTTWENVLRIAKIKNRYGDTFKEVLRFNWVDRKTLR